MSGKPLTLLAIAPILASACGGSGSTSGGTLKIGFGGMLAGKYQQYGVDEKDGVQLCINKVNAAGGVSFGGKTYTLQLDAQDDNADAAQAVQAAQKLVDDGVVAVVGHVFSTATIAASKIYHDNGIVMISPSATNPQLTKQGFNNVFRVVGRDDQQGPADADYIVKTLGAKKVAVVDDKSTYGQGLADQVAAQVATDGATVSDREHVDPNSSDFTAQLTSVKGSSPDAVFYGGYSPQYGPLVKQAHTLGLQVPFVSGDGSHDSQFITLAGSDASGAYASDAGPDKTLMPGFSSFNTDFKNTFKVDVFQYAPEAFDACNIIVQAMKNYGVDKASIVKGVAATKDYQGVTQTISFTSTGDLTQSTFTIYKVVNGAWVAQKAINATAS